MLLLFFFIAKGGIHWKKGETTAQQEICKHVCIYIDRKRYLIVDSQNKVPTLITQSRVRLKRDDKNIETGIDSKEVQGISFGK